MVRLPKRLQKSLFVQSLLRGPAVFTLGSWLRFLRVQKLGRNEGQGADPIALRVRSFGRQQVYMRPEGSDWETVHTSLIGAYHRPPSDITPIHTILDLGANIGITAADMAVTHPQARIMAVELDRDNVELAKRNTAQWADRVEIVHGAVWSEDGSIAYGGTRGEYAYQVLPAMRAETEAAAIEEVPAYSMVTLIDRLVGDGQVDYVKMDVEGAERFLLAEGEDWAKRVRCVQVEVHLPLDVATVVAELERLGFAATPAPGAIPSVTGRLRPVRGSQPGAVTSGSGT